MYEAKLYKVDSKGKVRFWAIETHAQLLLGDTNPNPKWGYTVSHGIEGSVNIVSSTTWVKPKNIGKKNETTPEQQADLEAESLMRKQMDKNYTPSITQAEAEDVGLLPMLAQRYDEHYEKIIFPCCQQPKLDGIRCLAIVRDDDIVLISRKAKEFKAVGHLKVKIAEALGYTITTIPDDLTVILDGELYSHNMTFQDIISATKRDGANDKSASIEYHLYDVVMDGDFVDRNEWLTKNITENSNVKLVETVDCNNDAEVVTNNQRFLDAGYEGSMLRNKVGTYEPDKRSYNLQKVKRFLDEEFEIIGAEQNKGKQSKECSFICKTKDGTPFKVKPKGDRQIREEYWTNHQAYIGKMLTCRFFEYTTSKSPIPRFPIGIAVRTDYE